MLTLCLSLCVLDKINIVLQIECLFFLFPSCRQLNYNTMQRTITQMLLCLSRSSLVTWSQDETKNSAFTFDWNSDSNKAAAEMWIFSFLQRCSCGSYGRVHCLEKIVKKNFIVKRQWTIFPETQKMCSEGQWLDVPRQNLLFFARFSPSLFFFYCGS